MNESWPYVVKEDGDNEIEHRGRAYLPTKLWLEICKKHPNVRTKSILELQSHNFTFLVFPFPPYEMHRDYIEVHQPAIVDGGAESVVSGSCKMGKVWYQPTTCPRVTLTSKLDLVGRIVVDGCHIGSSVISCDSQEPSICNLQTEAVLVKRKVSITPTYVDNGAYSVLESMLKAAIIGSELDIPRGILLSGPPGVGKTHLVRTLCTKLQIPIVELVASEIRSPGLGQTEVNLRSIFMQAQERGRHSCCVLFIDEVDVIGVKREVGALQHQVCLLAQLLVLIDGVEGERENVIVIGATNRPNDIDAALRRPGRFDREIIIEPPSEELRSKLLDSMLFGLDGVDQDIIRMMARRTIGYVPADLAALCREIILQTVSGIAKLDERLITRALALVGPSLTREYRVNVEPNLTWDSIGGLSQIKEELQKAVEWPLKYADSFTRLGIRPPRGILLYGPPGCSKTTIAKILASSGGFSFYSLSAASVYSCYVGEAERILRGIFTSARQTAPALVFIDELDALVGKRGDGDLAQERILSTLLNEMDGVETCGQVVVLGATNRIEVIDAALLRPGRFDRIVYVGLPDRDSRHAILKLLREKTPMDVNLEEISDKTDGYSGADMVQFVQEAALSAIRNGHSIINTSDLPPIASKYSRV
jgi:transitional endoplasmic reticulum ATPase